MFKYHLFVLYFTIHICLEIYCSYFKRVCRGMFVSLSCYNFGYGAHACFLPCVFIAPLWVIGFSEPCPVVLPLSTGTVITTLDPLLVCLSHMN